MTPDPTNPRHALEASLTALLLGELPPDQAAFLRQAIATDPELARMYARLERTINLVRETAAEPAPQPAAHAQPLKLSSERREQLLQRFKTVSHPAVGKAERNDRSWIVPTAIAATLMLLAGALALSSLSTASFKSQTTLARNAASGEQGKEISTTLSLDNNRLVPASPSGQFPLTLGLNRNSSWPTDSFLTAPTPSKGSEQAGRPIVSAQPGNVYSFAATPPPTILLPPKLPESESELARTAKALDGSTTGNAFFSLGGGMGGGGGGGAPATTPAENRSLDEHRDTAFTYSAAPAQEEALSRRYGLRLPKSEAKEPQAQAEKPPVAYSTPDRTAGGLAPGSQIYRGISVVTNGQMEMLLGPNNPLTQRETAQWPAQPQARNTQLADSNGAVLNWAYAGQAAQATTPTDPTTGLPKALSDELSMFSPGPPKFTGGFTNPVYIGGLEGSIWSDKEHQRNGGVLKVDGANQLADNHALSFDLPDSDRAGATAGKPTLGDVASLGTTFKEAPAREKQEMAVEQGVNEAVMRQAYRIQLRERLAEAKDAQSKNDLSKAAKLYDSASDLASKIGSDNVEPEMAQIRDGQTAVRVGAEPGQTANAGQVAAAMPTPATPAVIDPTTGLPVAEAAPSVDPTTGLPLPKLRSGRGASNIYELNVAGYVNVPFVSNNWSVRTGLKGFYDDSKSTSPELRSEQRKELAKAETATLQDRLAENEQQISKAQSNVDTLRQKLQISDYSANGTPPTVLISAETLRRIEQLRIESQAELVRQQTLLDKLNSMKNDPDALVKALPASGIQDQLIGTLARQRTLAEQQLASLKTQYGAENAETKKAAAQVDDLKSRINDRVAGVISGLETRVASLGQSLTNLQQEVDTATKSDLMAVETNAAYWEAKTKLEQLQRARMIMTNASDDARPPKPTTPPPEPQPEIQTRDNSFSTFSLNVSDVSFKLAGASLEKGVLPEPASIRSEEFINAFDYRDPEPAPGAPIAFAWERARYPFAQNRDLLRFSLKTAALGRQAGRPLNLVLLLDNSGSMERADRVDIIREALRVLATQLQPQDTFSVVLFARTPRLWVDGVPGNQAGKVADDLSGLTPEGGTNLGDALDLAYQTALRHYLMAGINRVVLLTDGAANLGNVEPEELKKKVEANRKQGIALDGFGIGWEGYNDDLLEVLTRNGDGRYGFINTPEEAATEFAGQLAGALHVAASDVKVQVEFNPKRVTAYRQIGYAKHQLTKEQFRDNSVDAAELGAAESGNALYVVDVNGAGEGPLATVRVRYKVPGTMQYQEHEWTVPYTGNAGPLEQASPALRLAASASAFSEWLATSPYAAEVTPDSVLGYLRGVPEVYGADARPKKLEWMIRQAKSLVGNK